MAKQTYEIKDFSGGLNCYSDARDIQDTEFSQFWNVTSSQAGILKVGGSLVEHIYGLPHTNTNFEVGYGLFATSIDSTPSILEAEFESGFEEGQVVNYSGTDLTLAALPSFQSKANHELDNFYRNMTVVITSGTGIGESRRIVSYTGSTKVAVITDAFSASVDNSSTYKIYKIAGDNTKFGNANELDYVDKGGTDFPYEDITSHGTDYFNSYFLRTKSSTVPDNQSLDLGFVTYNPANYDWPNSTVLGTDSTDVGNNTLQSGVKYTLSFWCKTKYNYYGYVSDNDNSANQRGERVPFVQMYSDSVTDGTNTGLYLFQSQNGPVFQSGSESTYDYADNLTNEYVKNGDFEDGAVTDGDGGYSNTYDPPENWKAYDGFTHDTNNTITYTFETGANAYGGEGNTLNMNPGSSYAFGQNTIGATPNCYLYQDLTLEDNQWYELSFLYSTSTSAPMFFSIVDTFDLTSTGIVSNDTSGTGSQKDKTDSSATLTVDTTVATDELVKNREIYTSTGTFLGVCTGINSPTEIVFGGGIFEDIPNDTTLYVANYINKWSDNPLSSTGGITTYKHSGGPITNPNRRIPFRFFVPNNSGTPRVIRIAFAPFNASQDIRLDGVSVKKSLPDLVSMSNVMTYGEYFNESPYNGGTENWNKYQMTFKIPSEYDDATDWVINLNAGSYGFQNGATNSYNHQIVYFDTLRLETNSLNDNLIFLNDNTSTESKINIYSENNNKWQQNTKLTWNGLNMKPVYNYINGMLKISDANFKSQNKSKLYYYHNASHHVRENPLSLPPPLLISANGNSLEVNGKYQALNYINEHSYLNGHQYYGPISFSDSTCDTTNTSATVTCNSNSSIKVGLTVAGTGIPIGTTVSSVNTPGAVTSFGMSAAATSTDTNTTLTFTEDNVATNWDLDKLNGPNGRVIWNYSPGNYGTNNNLEIAENKLFDALGNALTNVLYSESKTNPMYFTWCGSHGNSADVAISNTDMQSTINSVSTGSISRIEFEFTYEFQGSYSASSGGGNSLTSVYPPIFHISAGKRSSESTDVFASGTTVSDDNKIALSKGDVNFIAMENEKTATIYTDSNFTNIYDVPFEIQEGITWLNSQQWLNSTITNGGIAGSRARTSAKTFYGSISFEDGEIELTDDVIFKVRIEYHPNVNGYTAQNVWARNYTSNDSDWNFPRWEKIKFTDISCSFRNTSWTALTDGFTGADSNKTKVNFTFGTPTGATAFGWGERTFLTGVSSVNIFNEESNIEVNDGVLGLTATNNLETTQSNIANGQCPDVSVYVGIDVYNDDYRKKLKYYMKDTTSDIWYLQFYVDLEKNVIYSTTSNFNAIGNKSDDNKCYQYFIPKEEILNYNEVDSYESQTLVSQDLNSNELICDYKASVVANSRLYVGNIRQDGTHLPDRMLKSPIGKYNILPKSNFIDVAINDGDEITALEYYKDKLLQYKKRKVFVINTSGDFEFLEDTFDNVGVEAPYQVCKTPFGIAWANQSGLYLYNGESLVNLIKNKIPNNENDAIIANNFWRFSDDPDSNAKPLVGYDNITKDIVIKFGLATNTTTTTALPDGYIYNLESGTWYFTSKSMNGISVHGKSPNCSNFATDSKGNLMLYTLASSSITGIENNLNDILKWQHAKATDEALCNRLGETGADINAKPLYFTTKDYTFGAINSRDKIYKVYITYKSMNSSNASTDSKILVKYATNGSGSFTGTFDDTSTNYAASTGLTGSTTWTTAVLKPSSPINNVFSLQLQFIFDGAGSLPVPEFEINDISIIYRPKRIK